MVDTTLPSVVSGHWETNEGRNKALEYAGKRRADLAMSSSTDLYLANALYLADGDLPIQTAAKERMRWLSVQLALANARVAELEPIASEMLRITHAIGEGEDWGAAWERIYPAMGLQPGENDPEPDDDEEFGVCDRCGSKEHPVGVLDGGLCPTCLDELDAEEAD